MISKGDKGKQTSAHSSPRLSQPMHATPMDILSSIGLVTITPESNIIIVYIKPTRLIHIGVLAHNCIILYENIYPIPVGTIQE